MNPDFLLNLVAGIGAAAGVYAAIKADLTRAIVIAERAAQVADSAQDRISNHIDVHHTNHGGKHHEQA